MIGETTCERLNTCTHMNKQRHSHNETDNDQTIHVRSEKTLKNERNSNNNRDECKVKMCRVQKGTNGK